MSREDRGQGGILLASAARTASVNSPAVTNVCGGQNLEVIINCSADPASASVVFTIQGFDAGSQTWFDILASAAVNATGQRILRVSPHLTASANLIAKDIVPRIFRVEAVAADSDSLTYSVAYSLT